MPAAKHGQNAKDYGYSTYEDCIMKITTKIHQIRGKLCRGLFRQVGGYTSLWLSAEGVQNSCVMQACSFQPSKWLQTRNFLAVYIGAALTLNLCIPFYNKDIDKRVLSLFSTA